MNAQLLALLLLELGRDFSTAYSAGVAGGEVDLDDLGAGHQNCRLATMACSAGLLGLDTGHDKAKRISHALRLFGGLHQGFLQRLGRGRQTTWLSFRSLSHIADSVTVSWLASFAAQTDAVRHQIQVSPNSSISVSTALINGGNAFCATFQTVLTLTVA